MDREKIILYSEKTENLGEPETFLGRGEAREPGCGMCWPCSWTPGVRSSRSAVFTITESACPPLKACAARAAELAVGKPVMEAYLISATALSEFFGAWSRRASTAHKWRRSLSNGR